MSHLVSAKVDGLAGRKESINIKFDRHINIIYGLNGSGKTSLLKILHSAMSGDAKLLENVPFKSASVKIHSLNFKKIFLRQINKEKAATDEVQLSIPDEIEYRIGLEEFVQTHANKQAQLHWKQTPKDSPSGKGLTHWQHRYLPTTRLHISDDPFSPQSVTRPTNTLTEEILDQFFANSLTDLWAKYSSEIVRAVRDAQAKGLARILQAVLSVSTEKKARKKRLDLDKAYKSVIKFLERQGAKKVMTWDIFEQRYHSDSSLQQVVQDIHRVEQEIEEATQKRARLQSLIEKLYSGNKHVAFTDDSILVTDSSNKQIGLASLSSGEKHLMRILVETLLVKESTILIDEPELSMHVDWQHPLMSNMRLLNPSAQLIIATHSPEVMADISDSKIFPL